jgi:phospholipid/cholesterol/gamma-HCH transport system substrate-binding protein
VNRRTTAVAAALAALLGLATGCGPTMANLPLPGTGVGGDTITVTAEFDEALNLAMGAPVKVNGVAAGKVEDVVAKDFKARARLVVRKSAHMRTTAKVRLRYTTPLGELYVDVSNPADGPLLRDGQQLPDENTTTAPTVEDALSSATLLVNGGGLNQLQTVTDELNTALAGREDTVRQLFDRANTFLTQANGTSGDIDRALRALAQVSGTLAANQQTIDAAMRDIRPAAAVLRENTPAFSRLLAQLVQFSGAANDVVGRTRQDLLRIVTEITPVLEEFLANSGNLAPSFSALVGINRQLDNVIPGDYLNIRLDAGVLGLLDPSTGGIGGSTGGGGTGGGGGGILDPIGGILGGLLGGLTGGTGGTSGGTTSGGLLGLGGLLGGGQ